MSKTVRHLRLVRLLEIMIDTPKTRSLAKYNCLASPILSRIVLKRFIIKQNLLLCSILVSTEEQKHFLPRSKICKTQKDIFAMDTRKKILHFYCIIKANKKSWIADYFFVLFCCCCYAQQESPKQLLTNRVSILTQNNTNNKSFHFSGSSF